MSLTHSTAQANAIANLTVDALDAGTTNPNARLVFMTAGDATVATLNFANPAFGDAAAKVATANAIASDTNAVGGTIALFKVTDRDNVEVYRGTVTATGGGGDIELSSLVIAATDTVSLSSLTYGVA